MNNNSENINKDYGLSILRSILSFYVIRSHYLNKNSTQNKIIFYILGKRRSIHVPSFFIMSFYFNFKSLNSMDIKRNYKRFQRLLIPYIFWPIIIFSINNTISKYSHNKFQYPFKLLIIQLLFGLGIINVLYFQFCLIATTFLFIVIRIVFKNNYLFILNLIMTIDYLLQYSKSLHNIFADYRIECHYSLDRELDLIPLAVTGCNINAFNVIKSLKKYKFQTIIFSLLAFFLIDNFGVFSNVDQFYHYGGLKLNILSICLIFIFSLSFSFVNFTNNYIKSIIEYLTNYTAGIYYLHTTIYSYLKNYILSMKNETINGLLINYVISYSICHFGMIIFGKSKARHLFS